MNMHSEIYKRIRDNMIRTWPAWKRKIYNSCFAVSAHAEKLPENDRTRSVPVWTNFDWIKSLSVEKLASVLTDDWCEIVCGSPCGCDGKCEEKTLSWLKAPVDKERDNEGS